jgi:hypothetical protein
MEREQRGTPHGEEQFEIQVGEARVAASTFSSSRATPDELVAIGREVWATVKAAAVDPADAAATDALLSDVQTKFKDFSTSFPLVVRWAVQLREFSAKALRTFLMKHASATLDSRESFLRLQAEYPALLFRERGRHPAESAVNEYRETVVQALLKEDAEFTEIQREVEAEVARLDATAAADRRRRLVELVQQRTRREARET